MLITYPLSESDSIYINKKESSRALRISLQANIHGFFLIVPQKVKESSLDKFLKANKRWILKTYNYYKKFNNNFAITYESRILYFGKIYSINIVKDSIYRIIVSESLQKITFHVDNKKLYKKYIKIWYQKETTKIINDRIEYLTKLIDVQFNKVRIKDNSTLWGSCSSKKNLNFSMYLSAFPIEVIDYVIIHELVHLKEFNHSKKFWDMVRNIDPAYREHISYLKQYGNFVTL